jgi:hypothetical protein
MELMPRTRWIDEFVMLMSKRFSAESADALTRYASDVWVYRRHQAPVEAVEHQRMPMSDVQFWPARKGTDAWLEAQAGIYMVIDPRNAWDDCQEAAQIAYLEQQSLVDADPIAAIELIYSQA